MRSSAALLWISLALAPLTGCAGSAAEIAPVHAQPEIAAIAFGLGVASGVGTLQRETDTALRQALAEAGFQLTEADADLLLQVEERDQDAPQFFKIMVNGAEQKKLTVTLTLKILGGETRSDELERHALTFVTTQGQPIDAKQLRPLVKQLAESKKLQELGLNLAIDRSRKKLDSMGEGAGAEAPEKGKPTLDE